MCAEAALGCIDPSTYAQMDQSNYGCLDSAIFDPMLIFRLNA
jgi:hypothetical protein